MAQSDCIKFPSPKILSRRWNLAFKRACGPLEQETMHYTLKHWVRLMTPMAAAAMLALFFGQALAGHDEDRDDHRHGGHGGWGHHDGWGHRGGGGGWESGPNFGVYVGPAYPSYGY